MTEVGDPPRLSDTRANAPQGLRDLFSRGEHDLPSAAQVDQLAARLAPAFAAPATAAGGGGLQPGLLRGLGIAGGLAAVGIAAWVAFGSGTKETAKSVPSQPSVISAPAVSAPASSVAEPPKASNAENVPAPGSAEAPAATPGALAVRPRAQPNEAALLEQARRALAADPARAFALTRQHQQRFPNGILNQEREVIAIEALRRLGRASEAKDRAGSFEKQFPGSAHQRAVESGGGK